MRKHERVWELWESTEKRPPIQSNKSIQDKTWELSLQNIVTKLKLRNSSQIWRKVTKFNSDLSKHAFHHSGDFWLQFRNDRWVSNDRSGPDEAAEAQATQVGPVVEAVDQVEVVGLLADLAIRSDVIASFATVSFSSWCWPAAVVIDRRTNIVSISISISPLIGAQTT